MKKTLKRIKQTRFAQWLKKTRLGIFLVQSQGDWRYPFIAMGWQLSKTVVPRRKVSVEGVSFTLSCINWVTHFRWYLFRRKEQEVRYYIDNYVKEGDKFFDIGANVGVFSIYAGKRFQDISVYCFEPEYSNLNILKENIVCNALTGKTKIFSVAISDFVGPSSLHIQDFTPGSAVHTENRNPISVTDEGYGVIWAEGIIAVTLDYLCEQLGVIPNAIKIDTDGNEDKVLNGAAKILYNENLRTIILEMPGDDKKVQHCKRVLGLAGFKLDWSDIKKTRNEIWVRRYK